MLKVFKSKRNWKMLQQLWSSRTVQNLFAYDFCNFLNTENIYFEEEWVNQSLELNKDRKESKEKIVLGAMLYSLLESLFDIALPDYIIQRIIEEGKIFHVNELNENPYMKNIKIHPVTEGKFELSQNKYKKYELFTCDVFYEEPVNIVFPVVGYIDDDFNFPVLSENNKVWMSITPSEIITMQKDIDKAHGKVLTLGCGLGYFAYMAAIKENVESVTIVEKSSAVISLFKKHILPQFGEVKDKIKIIEDDAIDFMNDLEDEKYDFCFADIWENNIDIEPYLKLKLLEKKFKKMEISYWLEFHMVAYNIQSLLLMLITDEFEYKSKLDNIYPRFELIKKFVENVYEKDIYMKNPEDIKYHLNPYNIIRTINQRFKT